MFNAVVSLNVECCYCSHTSDPTREKTGENHLGCGNASLNTQHRKTALVLRCANEVIRFISIDYAPPPSRAT
eukprot:5968008-Amphidinium_carterae.1